MNKINNNLSLPLPLPLGLDPVLGEDNTKPRFFKSKIKSLYIDPSDISFDSFSNLILSNLRVNVSYSMLYKVKYDDTDFGMIGCQEGIILSSINDTESVQRAWDNLRKGIRDFSHEYSTESIDLIQMLYVIINDMPELKLKNINSIKLNKEFVNIKDEKFKFSSRLLPLSIYKSYYGKLLLGDERIMYLNMINKAKSILLHEKINTEDINSMYLYRNEYLILNKRIDDIVVSREVYDALTGKYKDTFIDSIVDKHTFTRKKGKLVLTIRNNNVIHVNASKDLPVIKYIPKPYRESPNPYIGSLDLETYKDLDDTVKIYALGFIVLGESPKTFFLGKNNDSDELLLKCFDTILTDSKYNGYTFYTHNFGKYDSVFISKILREANNRMGFDYYKLSPNYRNSTVLTLDVKVRKELGDRKQPMIGARKEPKFNKITIADSYALLNDNLYDLSRSFGVEVTKGYFPHSFVKKDTMGYVGNTPSIHYWKDIVSKDKGITSEEYNELYSENWCLKNECIKYLNKDLESLLNIMDTFNKYVFRKYDVQMTDSATISRLALNIFLKDYLKESCLPVIKSNMYKDIKQAYFGGVTEVYKPYGRNLYYYDVNSLYPFSSLNPMPGKTCNYIEDLSDEGLQIDDLFGFFYCEVETKNDYLGLLPVRGDGGILMPNGSWSGWYFSEELKFAANNNYKIKVVKGYNFDRSENVFNQYVHDIYKVKSNSEGHIKAIAKSLLNNLLGRFGMNINKPKTEIVNGDKLKEIQCTRRYESYPKQITNDEYLISYYPVVSREICESHGIDYVKVYMNSSDKIEMEKDKEFNDVSLTTAAAVTSYARIYMSKVKLDVLSKGGNIYYTDTDSLVTDKPLNHDLIGDKIGQFKLEYLVKKAYFITSKTYCLIIKENYTKAKLKKGDTCIKVKGAFNTSLNLKDFMDMYKGINVEAKKRNTVTNHEKGYVLILDKSIELNSDSYKKREKVYLKNKWTDTKPLIYNNSFKNDTANNNSDGNNKKKKKP